MKDGMEGKMKGRRGLAESSVDLGQVADLVRIEKKLLECACVAQQVHGDRRQAAVTLVDVVHLAVAPLPEWHALHRCSGGGGTRSNHSIS